MNPTTTRLWRTPTGRLHLQQYCSGSTSVGMMAAVSLTDAELLAVEVGTLCWCAWTKFEQARTRNEAGPAEPADRRGIRGLILTGWSHSPNGGISATVQEVTIVGGHVPERQPVTADAPAVVFAETVPGYLVLRPADEPGPGRTQYMASGAYVAPVDFTTWERVFGHHLPVPLHDRTETWAQYDAHSRILW